MYTPQLEGSGKSGGGNEEGIWGDWTVQLVAKWEGRGKQRFEQYLGFYVIRCVANTKCIIRFRA